MALTPATQRTKGGHVSILAPLITPEHAALLAGVLPPGLDPAVYGITSVGGERPGILFPWADASDPRGVHQLLPDQRRTDPKTGKPIKYEFPSGARPGLTRLRELEDGGPALIAEGTKQRYWVAAYAPSAYSVYAIAGCRMWAGDLTVFEGRTVLLMFDGDRTTNRDVYDAGQALYEALELAGATEVLYVRTPARGDDREGVDDVLAAMSEADRHRSLARWLAQAKSSPGKPPARRNGNPFMGKDGLMAETLANDILAAQPAALTAEGAIALYRGGVFSVDGDIPLIGEVVKRLGEQHRSTHMTSVKQVVMSQLYTTGRRLPMRTAEPLANFTNGMLDLRTGALLPHDPAYLSRIQHPVAWDYEAQCPVYEDWLRSVLPDQMDDIEEIAGSMLDRSRTPSKALFAFGPSHSGKSTFIRLLLALAGEGNFSAVTLHQLAENRFAAANVYGMALNASSDLSARDVTDLSAFKMMSGEDPIQADRKFGSQFSFTNTALFAFSANELPAVGESTNAYRNRVKPFDFNRSFEGKEDITLEPRLRLELPGIARRWAEAYARFLTRGHHLPTLGRVADGFDQGSDRVRKWVSDQARPSFVGPGAEPTVEVGSGTATRDLYTYFKMWAESNGYKPVGINKFASRLENIDGVQRVRVGPQRVRGFNLVMIPESDRQ